MILYALHKIHSLRILMFKYEDWMISPEFVELELYFSTSHIMYDNILVKSQ